MFSTLQSNWSLAGCAVVPTLSGDIIAYEVANESRYRHHFLLRPSRCFRLVTIRRFGTFAHGGPREPSERSHDLVK